MKIDVEGFEYEVLKGSSRPVLYISFEFTPEFIASTHKCIDHLQSLEDTMFNYSIGESMRFAAEKYVTSREMCSILEGYRHDNKIFGDVYCLQEMGV